MRVGENEWRTLAWADAGARQFSLSDDSQPQPPCSTDSNHRMKTASQTGATGALAKQTK
ncbi:hypothetical protein BIFGAL_03344 [Bifidobacterium gallicum DSM 20093 = LMG 11596]|uniref:Uncharacterized protein n=1 Tax=Bifidobacterium gallicum DSM 20093 = LMG 11596 TaxID=561180 RepID=D1NU23_9BIFI|nr:hypothetical protein BIFGAL_03344 [Bifidobacterium gallicum DSM 20093 = LMG 11596]